MTVDDFAINGFAIPKNIEESITDKYLFCYYLVKFAQEQERERINQSKEKHMNNTEIFSVAERMASHYVSGYCFNHADIAAFARWAQEQEREACAKLAESTVCDTHLPTGVRIYGTRAAAAIRARTQ